jgi:hypothetical protein
MKRLAGITLFVALAVTPLALEAQTTTDRPQERVDRMGQPFAMMLRRSTELGLSSDQVARIEAIGSRLRAQNAPLMEQVRSEMSAQSPRAGAPAGQRPRMGAPQRHQMRQRAAEMTPEQREALRARMQERHAEMSPEDRAAMRTRMEERRQKTASGDAGARGARMGRELPTEARAAMQQMHTNRQVAMQEARAVLTQEQQNRLQELAQQRRGMAAERMQRWQGNPNRR